MGMDERMRGVLEGLVDRCGEKAIGYLSGTEDMQKEIDQTITALKSCLGEQIRGMKRYVPSEEENEGLCIGNGIYNSAIDDVLRVVGEKEGG